MEDKLIEYGERLKSIRRQMRLSRNQIFLDKGIPAYTIRRWENGESEIGIVSLENYLKIFKSYGVNIPLKIFVDLERPIEKILQFKQ